ncbi:MAG TPA: DUF3226 domain-containing protein [Gemmataceae bacterium]|nr:DUF3226 domain-containing protein [Gemmataceae bacterium]
MPALPGRPKAIEKPCLVLGEGPDDWFFLSALVEELRIDHIQVDHLQGKDKLSLHLRALKERTGRERLRALAIVTDADDNFGASFRKVCNSLSAAGFAVPVAAGTHTNTAPSVGVFVLPDNARPGELEDLCLASIQADAAFACLDQFFECVKTASGREPREPSKARVLAWLAAQPMKGGVKHLGIAAFKGCWPWTDAAFQPLVNFLRLM